MLWHHRLKSWFSHFQLEQSPYSWKYQCDLNIDSVYRMLATTNLQQTWWNAVQHKVNCKHLTLKHLVTQDTPHTVFIPDPCSTHDSLLLMVVWLSFLTLWKFQPSSFFLWFPLRFTNCSVLIHITEVKFTQINTVNVKAMGYSVCEYYLYI